MSTNRKAKIELGRTRASAFYSALFPATSDLRLDQVGPWLAESFAFAPDLHNGTSQSYFLHAQQRAMFDKTAILPSDAKALEAKALKKWVEAENRCLVTNRRFRYYWSTGKWFGPARDLLPGISRRVSDMMGKAPADIFALKGRHGPGSTVSLRSDLTSVADKFAERKASATPKLADVIYREWSRFAEEYPYYFDCLTGNTEGADFHVGQLEINEVPQSRFTTVPKTFTSVRPIDIQATLNVFFQLGAGDLLRRRLKKARGVDLDNQADANRHMVRFSASEVATVDLTSASDHVSHNLVLDLLPPDWVEILDILRTPLTVLPDGTEWPLSKWSAMGNGYTFELETIIFKAIAEECVYQLKGKGWDDLCLTFGDDLIVPRECGQYLTEILADLGFVPNQDKTFLEGRFKESCGVDIFTDDDGPVDVRPIYIRAQSLVDIDSLYVTHNALTRALSRLDEVMCDRAGISNRSCDGDLGFGLRVRILRARCLVLSWIPERLRFYGPDYLGDVVLQRDPSEWLRLGFTPRENKKGLTCIRTWSPTAVTKRLEDYPPEVQMCVALYNTGQGREPHSSDHLDKPVERFPDPFKTGDHWMACRGRPSYKVRSTQVVIPPV